MEGRCRVDRCALFVDAGYVLGDGAMAVHGTRNRESVSWDYAGVLQVLRNVARDHTGLPLLRCYWYEATVEGRRSSDHEILADLPGVKLRLGKMKPGRREGVESEIHRDLTTLARNRAISDALVVSAEDDLAQVIADVQDLGLRVILVHIAAPGWTVAAALRQECDDIVEISEAHLRPSVELVVGAEPVGEEDRQAVGAYASRPAANGHGGTPGPLRQPALPAGSHAAQPAIYTGPVITEYQRAAQPANSHRPPLAGPPGPAVAGSQSFTAPPGAQPGMAPPPGAAAPGQGGTPGPRDITAQPGLPPAPAQPGLPPAPLQPGVPGSPSALAGPPPPHGHAAAPGQHAAVPGQHATPGQHPGQHAAPGQPMMPPGPPAPGHAPAHISGPLAAPAPAAPPPPAPRAGGQHAGPLSTHLDSGPAVGHHSQHAPPAPQFAPGQPMPGQPMPGQPMPGQPLPGPAIPGQPVPGQPGAPALAQGYPAPPGPPSPQALQSRQGMPAYQAAPPPAPPQAALAPPAAPPGYSGQPADGAAGQAPAGVRLPTAGAPPGPAMTAPPGAVPPGVPAGGVPVAGVPAGGVPAGQQARGIPAGYPGVLPGRLPAAPARQLPAPPGQPGGGMPGPYVPPQGPHSGPQPAAQHALVPQPVAVSLADAVQAAHGEGFNFGQAVARDAPALWLEAVLARKPRMPSDLEARLLQDSSLPIDSLLHDEVRHALRRGFWDALERVRH
jgi:NYN domain